MSNICNVDRQSFQNEGCADSGPDSAKSEQNLSPIRPTSPRIRPRSANASAGYDQSCLNTGQIWGDVCRSPPKLVESAEFGERSTKPGPKTCMNCGDFEADTAAESTHIEPSPQITTKLERNRGRIWPDIGLSFPEFGQIWATKGGATTISLAR